MTTMMRAKTVADLLIGELSHIGTSSNDDDDESGLYVRDSR